MSSGLYNFYNFRKKKLDEKRDGNRCRGYTYKPIAELARSLGKPEHDRIPKLCNVITIPVISPDNTPQDLHEVRSENTRSRERGQRTYKRLYLIDHYDYSP